VCILPSRIEFDEIEARERLLESKVIDEIESMTKLEEAEKKRRIEEMMKANVLRFAGSMMVGAAH